MSKRFKLSAKIVAATVAVLILTSCVSFWITQRRINHQAEDAFRDKVRQIVGMATTTQTWFSENESLLVPGQNFQSLNQVPVVAAWSVAQRYAEKNGMTFRTPSVNARNPKNQPDEFERRALEAFRNDRSVKEFSERTVVNGREVMRYAQPIFITQDCLYCHGDPVGAPAGFGYTKEGMKTGDLRGAFCVMASTDQLVATARSNSLATFLLSFMTLLASGGAVYFVVQRIVARPLARSVALANRIAGNDLTAEDLAVDSSDEIGETNRALNAMKNNLRNILDQIAITAESVASASQEISATASEQSGSAETQNGQIKLVAAAMEQMTTTVTEVSGNTSRAASAARESAEVARTGGEIVERTLATMRIISHAVAETQVKVDGLGSRSREIGKIIAVIGEIADQTNLLALNAAIEAARAGDQGRGFAVVADEVRKLAERTTTATQEITKMIESTQSETQGAVEAMEEGARQVKDGLSETSQAGESLRKIIRKSEEVGDMITMIATAAAQQSSTSEEIKSNMQQISALVESSTIGTQQAALACQDLSGLTQGLQETVERFELGRGIGRSRASVPDMAAAGKGKRTAPREWMQ